MATKGKSRTDLNPKTHDAGPPVEDRQGEGSLKGYQPVAPLPVVTGAVVNEEGLEPDEAAAAIAAAATPASATQARTGMVSSWACLTPAGLPAASGSAVAMFGKTEAIAAAIATAHFKFDIRHPKKCFFAMQRQIVRLKLRQNCYSAGFCAAGGPNAAREMVKEPVMPEEPQGQARRTGVIRRPARLR